jgi:flagellar protein FlaG
MDVKAIAQTQSALEMVSSTAQSVQVAGGKAGSGPESDFNKLDSRTQRAIIEKSVEAFNEKMEMMNSQLRIEFDQDTGLKVVKIIDKNTKEVIRQIPSETMLKIAKYIDELTGLLFDKKA